MQTYYPNRACTCTRCRCRGIMGPVVMVLLGVLALLHTFQLLSFHRSWPLLLIGIGAVMVLQRSAPLDDHVSPNLPPGPPAGPNASEVRNG